MNLTEQSRVRTLGLVMPRNENSTSGWKGYAIKATVLAIGFGTYVLLFRKKGITFRRGFWCFRRSRRNLKDAQSLDPGAKDVGNSKPIATYNREICPICLGAPKIGVRAPCGHLLCADCLASYCDVRVAPAPPPCPLCRAPLESVALACDLAILCQDATKQSASRDVRNWIHEYNLHRGLIAPKSRATGFLPKRIVVFVNVMTLLLIAGLIAIRLQVLPWPNWTAFGSILDVTLIMGIALMTCVWFKCQEQAAISYQ